MARSSKDGPMDERQNHCHHNKGLNLCLSAQMPIQSLPTLKKINFRGGFKKTFGSFVLHQTHVTHFMRIKLALLLKK